MASAMLRKEDKNTMKTAIATTPEVRELNLAVQFFDAMTLYKYHENTDLRQLASIAESLGWIRTAEIMREHAAK